METIETQLVIDGEWRPSSSGMLYDVHNPANPEELVGQAARGNADDVNLAVEAAHKAFPAWSSLSYQERAEYLSKVDKALVEDENDLKFRNLGGNAVLNHPILPEAKRLTMRARMTKVSEAAEMIIDHIERKRDALGINKKAERKLYDMDDRRALVIE